MPWLQMIIRMLGGYEISLQKKGDIVGIAKLTVQTELVCSLFDRKIFPKSNPYGRYENHVT